jgi:hypothetical protein
MSRSGGASARLELSPTKSAHCNVAPARLSETNDIHFHLPTRLHLADGHALKERDAAMAIGATG